MKKQFLLGIYLVTFSSLILANQTNSILGLWKAHNDAGKPTGFIRITQQADIYTGKIEKGLPSDKVDQYCDACKDERKGQKLIGMTILKGVQAKGENDYAGQEVLDPFIFMVKASAHCGRCDVFR